MQNCLAGLKISLISVNSSTFQSPFFNASNPSHTLPIVPINHASTYTAT